MDNQIITEKHFEKPTAQRTQSIVKFTNFSDEDFTHTWNSIPYTFPKGASKYMETGIANHFAKHLINRELLKRGRESDTSPKKPEENTFYMEFYRRCISAVEVPGNGPVDQTKLEQEVIDRNTREALGEASPDLTPEAPAAPEGEPEKPSKRSKEDKEFETLDVPDDGEDLPPAQPSNMAAKGDKPVKKSKSTKK